MPLPMTSPLSCTWAHSTISWGSEAPSLTSWGAVGRCCMVGAPGISWISLRAGDCNAGPKDPEQQQQQQQRYGKVNFHHCLT